MMKKLALPLLLASLCLSLPACDDDDATFPNMFNNTDLELNYCKQIDHCAEKSQSYNASYIGISVNSESMDVVCREIAADIRRINTEDQSDCQRDFNAYYQCVADLNSCQQVSLVSLTKTEYAGPCGELEEKAVNCALKKHNLSGVPCDATLNGYSVCDASFPRSVYVCKTNKWTLTGKNCTEDEYGSFCDTSEEKRTCRQVSKFEAFLVAPCTEEQLNQPYPDDSDSICKRTSTEEYLYMPKDKSF